MKIADIRPEVYEASERAENRLFSRFREIHAVAEKNTRKVLEAFQNNRVSDACFAGTTGYGYDDLGREVLDKVYADIFHTESALVRLQFVNGTHALTTALFAMASPGEKILSVTGKPYDTLQTAIGISGNAFGSLKFYGIDYGQIDLKDNGEPDYAAIRSAVQDPRVSTVMIQRSRGYENRRALSVTEIGKIIETVKKNDPSSCVLVDNCYGEFTEVIEPTDVGADLIAGSLIKNPGGGIAPTGAYIAGKRELIERAAMRLTSPGIGGECGSTLGNNRLLYQGLFLAPHIVSQALKTACFCAAMMEEIGIDTSPHALEARSDIIQMIRLGSAKRLKSFCLGIQAGAPVDSYVTPEPWNMPGYDCPVIMAAGAFIQGSSIELSADGPMRDPYIAYMQGGLTYESGKIGIMMAVNAMMDETSEPILLDTIHGFRRL